MRPKIPLHGGRQIGISAVEGEPVHALAVGGPEMEGLGLSRIAQVVDIEPGAKLVLGRAPMLFVVVGRAGIGGVRQTS